MIIRQFQYLTALVQERHFGRAAKRCGVTQPTLSSAIQNLEDELGVPIVMRGQRFIGLTAEGKRVLEWAQKSLADQATMFQELSEMKGNLFGQLRIGVIPTALSVVSRLTLPFCQQHPKVSVIARALSSSEILQGLDNFEIDVGITYLDNEAMLRIKSLPLYNERYCLIHAIAEECRTKKTAISWKEAALFPLCLLSRDMQNRRIIDSAFATAGVAPKPQIETNDLTDIGLHVKTRKWASIVPQQAMGMLSLPPETSILSLNVPTISHSIGVVWSLKEPTPPTAKAMLEIVKTVRQQDKFIQHG